MNQKPQQEQELELNKQELEQVSAGSQNPEYDIKQLESTVEIERLRQVTRA